MVMSSFSAYPNDMLCAMCLPKQATIPLVTITKKSRVLLWSSFAPNFHKCSIYTSSHILFPAWRSAIFGKSLFSRFGRCRGCGRCFSDDSEEFPVHLVHWMLPGARATLLDVGQAKGFVPKRMSFDPSFCNWFISPQKKIYGERSI